MPAKLLAVLILLLMLSFGPVSGQTFIRKFATIGSMAQLGKEVIFVADDGLTGQELWKTDGTPEGTLLIKDLVPGRNGSNPGNLFTYNNEVYFAGYDAVRGVELWKTDGTAAGTVLVKDLVPNSNLNYPSSNPGNFVVFKGALYFSTSQNGFESFIWKTDGTEAGTIAVIKSAVSVSHLRALDNTLYFVRRYGPWRLMRSDGTEAGTEQVMVDDNYNLDDFYVHNKDLFFITHSSYRSKIRLYKINASLAAPVLLKDFSATSIYTSTDIGNFISIKDDFFFSFRSDYLNETDQDVLWKTNGTVEGTLPVQAFTWERHMHKSEIQNFTSFQDKLYFSGPSRDNSSLWVSDGTASGTRIEHQVSVTKDTNPVVAGGLLYFNSMGKLWRSDGTVSGTLQYANLNSKGNADIGALHSLQNTLYFSAKDDQGLGLWNALPAPEINITRPYSLFQNELLNLTSKVDSVVSYDLEISNEGNKELVISSVQVSGSPFYISGSIPEAIGARQKQRLKLHYLPLREGEVQGSLLIRSNDLNESRFQLTLKGLAKEKARNPLVKAAGQSFYKDLAPTGTGARIRLDPGQIMENAPRGTAAGHLLIPDANTDLYTFSFAAGPGDHDNAYFTLNKNQVLAAVSFDQETRTTYSIRLRAISSTDTLFQALTILVQDKEEPMTFAACQPEIRTLSYGLRDVAFAGENHVVAIGENGAILKSENAGKNWREINSGVSASLSKIQFTNDKIGYIVGEGSLMLKTEDGGNSWFLLELPDKTYPYASKLFFVSPLLGFVYGGESKVFKTLDGGKTWELLRSGFNTISNAFFVNENLGFFIEAPGTLLKTLDGGRTVQRISMSQLGWNYTIADIQFLNEQKGFILGRDGQVLKTEDSGLSWTKIGQVNANYAIQLTYLNEQEAYITGGWNGETFYKSEDGGLTWQSQPSQGYSGLLGLAFSPSGKLGCLVGKGTSLGSTSDSGRIIAIKAPGTNWTNVATLNPEDFRAIKFVSKQTGFLFGTISFRTADGGITWQKIPQLTGGIFFNTFLNESQGFALNGTDVFKTVDAGLTWTKMDAANTMQDNLQYLYAADALNLFVLGGNGTLYQSADGGQTWVLKQSNSRFFYGVNNFFFHNKNLGFNASTSGILKTIDGGLSWQQVYTPDSQKNQFPNSVYFLNASIGFAGGNNGLLLKTIDGGNTWQQIPIGIVPNFRYFDFLDANNGYAVANNNGGLSWVYSTTDGGLTWQQMISFDENVWEGFRLGDEIYFAGGRGLMQKIAPGRAPLLPGYIRGQMPVSESGREDYSVPAAPGTYYSWSVDGGHNLSYIGHQATVHWQQPGTYTIRVTAYNSCSTGETRELKAEVQALTQPQITGPNPVKAQSLNQRYTTPAQENNEYTWFISGQKSFTPAANEVSINWGPVGPGSVEVLALNRMTGSTKKATLPIEIQQEIVSGLPPEKQLQGVQVYPNPSPGEVLIHLENNSKQDLVITVHNTSGGLLLSRTFPKKGLSFSGSLHLGSLPNGLYILKINQGGRQTVYKLVKAS